MSETNTEQPTQEEDQLLLNIGDRSFDFVVLAKAIAYAKDFVLAEDVKNAAKNIGALKPSPLSEALDEAFAMVQEIFAQSAAVASIDGEVVEDAAAESPVAA